MSYEEIFKRQIPRDMTLKEYEHHALRTANGGTKTLNEDERLILNCCLGLAGESGELVDMVKKYLFHDHPFDTENAVKELGDIHWYWSVMCHTIGVDPNEVLRRNVEKLYKRYPNGFSPEDSIARRDQE